MGNPSDLEIAGDWSLWCKFIPGTVHTEDEFDAMTIGQRLSFIIECFGEEEQEDDWETDTWRNSND